MNSDTLKGDWKKLQGQVKEKWGKLTNDHLDVIEGKKEQLVGHIQKEYGISKEEAQKQVDDFDTHYDNVDPLDKKHL